MQNVIGRLRKVPLDSQPLDFQFAPEDLGTKPGEKIKCCAQTNTELKSMQSFKKVPVSCPTDSADRSLDLIGPPVN